MINQYLFGQGQSSTKLLSPQGNVLVKVCVNIYDEFYWSACGDCHLHVLFLVNFVLWDIPDDTPFRLFRHWQSKRKANDVGLENAHLPVGLTPIGDAKQRRPDLQGPDFRQSELVVEMRTSFQ